MVVEIDHNKCRLCGTYDKPVCVDKCPTTAVSIRDHDKGKRVVPFGVSHLMQRDGPHLCLGEPVNQTFRKQDHRSERAGRDWPADTGVCDRANPAAEAKDFSGFL